MGKCFCRMKLRSCGQSRGQGAVRVSRPVTCGLWWKCSRLWLRKCRIAGTDTIWSATLIDRYRRFVGTYCFQLWYARVFYVEDANATIFRSVYNYPPGYMTSYFITKYSARCYMIRMLNILAPFRALYEVSQGTMWSFLSGGRGGHSNWSQFPMLIPNSVFWAPFEFCEGELISFAVCPVGSPYVKHVRNVRGGGRYTPLHPRRLLSAVQIRYFSTMRMFPRDETRGVVARDVNVTSSDNTAV